MFDVFVAMLAFWFESLVCNAEMLFVFVVMLAELDAVELSRVVTLGERLLIEVV